MAAYLLPLTIDAALTVCRALPLEEQQVSAIVSGGPYDADETAIAAVKFPGMHWAVYATRESGRGFFVDMADTSPQDKLLAVGGFIQQREGVFRTWFLAVEQAWTAPYAQALTELVRSTIQQMLDRQLAHRIETVTLARQEKARAWYGQIGLTFESTLRGYCATGEDAVMYVAVRDAEKT